MPDPLDTLAAAEAGTVSEDEAGGGLEPEPQQENGPLATRFNGDPAALERSYQELETFLGQQSNSMGKEIAELKSQLSQYAQAVAQPQYEEEYTDQGGIPDIGYDRLQEWYDTNPVEATAYLVSKAIEGQMGQYEQRFYERVKPLEEHAGEQAALTIADGLRRTLGNDVYKRVEPDLRKALDRDPALLQGDPKIVYERLKDKAVRLEWERSQNGNAIDGAPGSVQVQGGSRGRPPATTKADDLTPEEALKQELTQTKVELDMFGNPKRAS